MNGWSILTGTTALLSTAAGGAFLTFSTFTTAGLARLRDAEGMAAMQQMNVTAPRSATFMALMFVPGLLALVLLGRVVVRWQGTASALVLAGALVYLIGAVGMTMAFHVPRNEALNVLDAATQHDAWQAWLGAWVLGNHVRTAAGLLSGALLGLALLVTSPTGLVPSSLQSKVVGSTVHP